MPQAVGAKTGPIWLLTGRPVVALTATTAAIKSPTGAITVYPLLRGDFLLSFRHLAYPRWGSKMVAADLLSGA
jgi:hypothetical protein